MYPATNPFRNISAPSPANQTWARSRYRPAKKASAAQARSLPSQQQQRQRQQKKEGREARRAQGVAGPGAGEGSFGAPPSPMRRGLARSSSATGTRTGALAGTRSFSSGECPERSPCESSALTRWGWGGAYSYVLRALAARPLTTRPRERGRSVVPTGPVTDDGQSFFSYFAKDGSTMFSLSYRGGGCSFSS